METRDVVIIGGGPAGRTIVHMLHASGKELSIVMIKDEKINVNRCAIPYGISGPGRLKSSLSCMVQFG
jgi:NADH oxidase (H2O2-forming)